MYFVEVTVLIAALLPKHLWADDACLLQLRSKHNLPSSQASCSDLKNQGSFFSVNVCVGTPRQCFDLVADTGSNAVIIPSCICGETPYTGCDKNDPCFRGTNKSSTFNISKTIRSVSLTFGSGTIEAAIATDVVRVGNIEKKMEDGVLLMTNRAALRIAEFTGILGLGIPGRDKAVASLLQGSPLSDALMICLLFPTRCRNSHNSTSSSPGSRPFSFPFPFPGQGGHNAPNRVPWHHPGQHGKRGVKYKESLFMDKANVGRFSICFRDNNQSGALRMNIPPFENTISNIGTFHWGMNFQGLSVGAHGASVPDEILLCGPDTMREGMDSPCGIIPDSGTTLIMGPRDQVALLEKTLCSKWPRCATAAKGQPSSHIYRMLLRNCSEWLTDEHGLLEIPSTFFNVKGAKGGHSSFELTAWGFVTVYSDEKETKKMCTSSFGAHEYNTQKNGPVWILGTPLFYEYEVGYDLNAKQMSLKKGHCHPCTSESNNQDAKSVMLSESSNYKRPRVAFGKPRMPNINTDLPL